MKQFIKALITRRSSSPRAPEPVILKPYVQSFAARAAARDAHWQ